MAASGEMAKNTLANGKTGNCVGIVNHASAAKPQRQRLAFTRSNKTFTTINKTDNKESDVYKSSDIRSQTKNANNLSERYDNNNSSKANRDGTKNTNRHSDTLCDADADLIISRGCRSRSCSLQYNSSKESRDSDKSIDGVSGNNSINKKVPGHAGHERGDGSNLVGRKSEGMPILTAAFPEVSKRFMTSSRALEWSSASRSGTSRRSCSESRSSSDFKNKNTKSQNINGYRSCKTDTNKSSKSSKNTFCKAEVANCADCGAKCNNANNNSCKSGNSVKSYSINRDAWTNICSIRTETNTSNGSNHVKSKNTNNKNSLENENSCNNSFSNNQSNGTKGKQSRNSSSDNESRHNRADVIGDSYNTMTTSAREMKPNKESPASCNDRQHVNMTANDNHPTRPYKNRTEKSLSQTKHAQGLPRQDTSAAKTTSSSKPLMSGVFDVGCVKEKATGDNPSRKFTAVRGFTREAQSAENQTGSKSAYGACDFESNIYTVSKRRDGGSDNETSGHDTYTNDSTGGDRARTVLTRQADLETNATNNRLSSMLNVLNYPVRKSRQHSDSAVSTEQLKLGRHSTASTSDSLREKQVSNLYSLDKSFSKNVYFKTEDTTKHTLADKIHKRVPGLPSSLSTPKKGVAGMSTTLDKRSTKPQLRKVIEFIESNPRMYDPEMAQKSLPEMLMQTERPDDLKLRLAARTPMRELPILDTNQVILPSSASHLPHLIQPPLLERHRETFSRSSIKTKSQRSLALPYSHSDTSTLKPSPAPSKADVSKSPSREASMESCDAAKKSSNLKVKISVGRSSDFGVPYTTPNEFDYFNPMIVPLPPERTGRLAEQLRARHYNGRALCKRMSRTSETPCVRCLDVNIASRLHHSQDTHRAFTKGRIPTYRRSPAHLVWPIRSVLRTGVGERKRSLSARSASVRSPWSSVTTVNSSIYEVSSVLSQVSGLPRRKRSTQIRADLDRAFVRIDQHNIGGPRFYPWAPFNPVLVQQVRQGVLFSATSAPLPHLSRIPPQRRLAEASQRLSTMQSRPKSDTQKRARKGSKIRMGKVKSGEVTGVAAMFDRGVVARVGSTSYFSIK